MSDKIGQIQEQKLTQGQKLSQSISQQQLLVSSLVELPITQLADRISTEMNDNPALEADTPSDPQNYDNYLESPETTEDTSDYFLQHEREERQTALDEALASIGRDDEELPVYHGGNDVAEEHEEMVYAEGQSFFDLLEEQIRDTELTDRQRDIMEYLVGSLDNDGLLRKTTDVVCDELAIYHNLDVTPEEVQQVLDILQDFDPAGIGANSLQECLLLQIRRRPDSVVKKLMEQVIDTYFDEFTHKHWNKIQQELQLSDEQAKYLIGELRRLNPRPGASMGEAIGRSLQQITPDFIVDTQDDGTITFTINGGDIPELVVSQSFVDSMKEYQENREHISRQDKEAFLYIKKKLEAAQSFIEAIKTRYNTLTVTMQTIINYQRQFFLDGDETSLRPMILKDVADRTGLNVSTISRVCSSKYAQTRWGTFPLRYFFSDSLTVNGEEFSTRKIKAILRDIIDNEDKAHPLSDDAISEELARRGFPIARRTVAKYREQQSIPVARLRK